MLDKLLKMDTALLTIKTQIAKYKALFEADGTIDASEQAILDEMEANVKLIEPKLGKVIEKAKAVDTLDAEYDKEITQEEAEALFYPLLETWNSEGKILNYLSTCVWAATETRLTQTPNQNVAYWVEVIASKLYAELYYSEIVASKGRKKYSASLVALDIYFTLDANNMSMDTYPRAFSEAAFAILIKYPEVTKRLKFEVDDINTGQKIAIELLFYFQVQPYKK
jgi:hypothetical protein